MTHDWNVQNDGSLYVRDILGDKTQEGVLDNFNPHPEAIKFMENMIWPYVKIYSFADLLKKHVCMDILGMSYQQCYGDNNAKNELTDLLWEHMPLSHEVAKVAAPRKAMLEKSGKMTGREVLQYVGTEVFRSINQNVWANATINKIKKDASEFALICDVRFPSEVEAIKNAGGRVIRLTKNGDKPTTHESESALDKNKFDWSKFDHVMDNENMDINQQCKATFDILTQWKWLINGAI